MRPFISTIRKTLVLVGAALVWVAPAHALSVNNKASSVASALIDKPVVVICAHSYEEWDAIPYVKAEIDAPNGVEPAGYTTVGSNVVMMSPAACDYKESPGFAAIVLTHEAIHVSGIIDEKVTECLAGKNVWRTIMLLGFRGKRARVVYREAMDTHNDMIHVDGYDWRGAC